MNDQEIVFLSFLVELRQAQKDGNYHCSPYYSPEDYEALHRAMEWAAKQMGLQPAKADRPVGDS